MVIEWANGTLHRFTREHVFLSSNFVLPIWLSLTFASWCFRWNQQKQKSDTHEIYQKNPKILVSNACTKLSIKYPSIVMWISIWTNQRKPKRRKHLWCIRAHCSIATIHDDDDAITLFNVSIRRSRKGVRQWWQHLKSPLGINGNNFQDLCRNRRSTSWCIQCSPTYLLYLSLSLFLSLSFSSHIRLIETNDVSEWIHLCKATPQLDTETK